MTTIHIPELSRYVASLGLMHEVLAAQMHSEKNRLECRVCQEWMKLSEADSAKYFQAGWPTCCGQTMILTKE